MPLQMQCTLEQATSQDPMSQSVAAVRIPAEGQLIGHVKVCLFPSMHQATIFYFAPVFDFLLLIHSHSHIHTLTYTHPCLFSQ